MHSSRHGAAQPRTVMMTSSSTYVRDVRITTRLLRMTSTLVEDVDDVMKTDPDIFVIFDDLSLKAEVFLISFQLPPFHSSSSIITHLHIDNNM